MIEVGRELLPDRVQCHYTLVFLPMLKQKLVSTIFSLNRHDNSKHPLSEVVETSGRRVYR